MNSPNKNLIPSATAIILHTATEGHFKVLLLQRNAKIQTHGGSWVFPGGKCDPQDFEHTQETGHFAQMSLTAQQCIARHAAVRETREEAGFSPNLSSLKLISNWITPETMSKRFNTFFFITEHDTQDVTVDQSEICDYCWLTPGEALRKQATGEFILPPPTYLSLLQLSQFNSAQQAIKSMGKVLRTYRPTLIKTDTGFHSVYEEDAGYSSRQINLALPRHRLVVENGQYTYFNDL